MALPRPTEIMKWAASASAYLIEPAGGRKDSGFYADERIPQGWLNWLFRKGFDWLAFVDQYATPGSIAAPVPIVVGTTQSGAEGNSDHAKAWRCVVVGGVGSAKVLAVDYYGTYSVSSPYDALAPKSLPAGWSSFNLVGAFQSGQFIALSAGKYVVGDGDSWVETSDARFGIVLPGVTTSPSGRLFVVDMSNGEVHFTDDEASSWTSVSVPALSGLTSDRVAIAADGSGNVVIVGKSAGGGVAVLYSNDAGATWSTSPITSFTRGTGSTFDDVVATDNGFVAVGGVAGATGASFDEGFVFYSSDGGASWTEGTLLTGQNSRILGVCSLGSSRLVAHNYAGQILLSYDGGASWRAFSATPDFRACKVVGAAGAVFFAGSSNADALRLRLAFSAAI